MFRSVRDSGHVRLAVAVTVVVLIIAGWFCLAESHEEHDHALPHELCAGMVVVAATMLSTVKLAPAGAMIPDLVRHRPLRAVPVLLPPPRLSHIR